MKAHRPHRWGTPALFTLILLLSSACGAAAGGEPAPPEDTTTQDTIVELELGPGTFDLANTSVGLDQLSSYRAALTLAFDGTQDGQPLQWSTTFELIHSQDPRARQLTVQQTGAASEDDPLLPELIAEIDGTLYERFPGGSCTATAAHPTTSPLDSLEPAAQLRSVFGGTAAGHEVLDGIEADRYTFDERALARKGISESTGEVWVSTELGHVVRYVLSTAGSEEFFGKGIKGHMTWNYQVSEVDMPISIELPEDCPPGLVSAPMLPDAGQVFSAPGMLRYVTASTPPEVDAFYVAALAQQGWTVPVNDVAPEGISAEEYQQAMQAMQALGMSEPEPTPNPDNASLEYTRDGETLNIVATRGDAGTMVMIVLSRSPEPE